jgi:hypothetical protein
MNPPVAKLKNIGGWFAAGDPFRRALCLLPNGSFKMFAYLSMQADRRTGRLEATQLELAAALNKSRRAIGIYTADLRQKGLCLIDRAKNKYSKTTYEICDEYWPYHREPSAEKEAPSAYVMSIRQSFFTLGCTNGRFSPGDIRKAQDFERRGIPFETVRDAMLTGACRKYVSWLDGHESTPIGSLSYFEPLVAEIQHQPLPPEYRDYLNMQLKKLDLIWKQRQWMKKRVEALAQKSTF